MYNKILNLIISGQLHKNAEKRGKTDIEELTDLYKMNQINTIEYENLLEYL